MKINHDHFRQALQRTPFHDRISALSTTETWTGWNTYKVARVVDKLSAEYFAVRSGCAVMDLTPMEKYRITGKDAYAYLDRLLTRDISTLKPGRVTYVVWCDDAGKVIDDGTLFQFGEQDYRLCSQHHQLDWLLMSASGYDVQIETETHDVAALAVQGPTSYSVLDCRGHRRAGAAKTVRNQSTSTAGTSRSLCRARVIPATSATRFGSNQQNALRLWDAIFSVQDRYDIQPMGLDALEMVRIEAGFIMPGFDFNTAESTIRNGYDRSPYEVGLGWVVNLDKGHFTGRKALIAEKAQPIKRRLTKIVVDGNKPVGEAFIYTGKGGKLVGEIKCTIWSPVLKANLALADIDYVKGRLPEKLWARFDYQRELKWRTAWAECHAQTKPFYNPEHRSALRHQTGFRLW